MRTIWKYPCSPEPWRVDMPKGAEIVAFDDIRGRPFFWAIVDSERNYEERFFVVVGTGHPAPFENKGRYLGTCQQLDGALVWHLFELSAP